MPYRKAGLPHGWIRIRDDVYKLEDVKRFTIYAYEDITNGEKESGYVVTFDDGGYRSYPNMTYHEIEEALKGN